MLGNEVAPAKFSQDVVHPSIFAEKLPNPQNATWLDWSMSKSKKATSASSSCPVTRGEVDLEWYAQRDEVWRELGLAAPARRALVNAGLLSIKDLRKFPRLELVSLHGMGPKALALLNEILDA